MDINETTMEKSLIYLGTTDEEFGILKSRLEECEIMRKRARARELVLAEGSSVALKQAMAEDTKSVINADYEYIEATREYEVMKNKRQRAMLQIDIWRTLEASRRRT